MGQSVFLRWTPLISRRPHLPHLPPGGGGISNSLAWRGRYTPGLKSKSNAARAHKTRRWLKHGPICVRRPLVKCTGGETGPRKRFPLVPRPSEAKKGPKLPKFKNSPPITNGSNMDPITTDFDETRWDLIPPMRPRSSGGSRVKKPNFEIYFQGWVCINPSL